jgi:hypothetical protein
VSRFFVRAALSHYFIFRAHFLFIPIYFRSEQADKARSQAAQRLATKEGWNIFYSWLKKAYEANEREKIVSLLQTCQEVRSI